MTSKRIYVITGGPGVGKTTVIDELKKHGFVVVEECARTIIKEELEKGTNVLPWDDLKTFQERVSKRQIEMEEAVTENEFFVDRGVVDGLAYLRIGSLPSNETIEKMGRNRYSKVFVLDKLPFYQNDSERRENQEGQKIIHDAICAVYNDFGYKIIQVPFGTPEQRVNFIKQKILPNVLPKA